LNPLRNLEPFRNFVASYAHGAQYILSGHIA
jgi:hypothetical protein